MKHVKKYEKRNFKDYSKYNDGAFEFFEEKIKISIDWLKIYQDNGVINLTMKIWNTVDRDFFNEIEIYLGKTNFNITPKNGSQLELEFYDIDVKFLDILEIYINSKKYNI